MDFLYRGLKVLEPLTSNESLKKEQPYSYDKTCENYNTILEKINAGIQQATANLQTELILAQRKFCSVLDAIT
jgi:hypothetical protein